MARALFDLPLTAAAFQSGELSYSKARALTRIATPETEERLVNYAIPATALQVDDHCRRLRNVQRDLAGEDEKRLHRERHLTRSHPNDGSMTISVEFPRESGELVMKALEMALANMQAPEGEEPAEEDSLQQQQADALVEMAKGYLAGDSEKSRCTSDHYQVVVHVDEKALAGSPDENSESDLPINGASALL